LVKVAAGVSLTVSDVGDRAAAAGLATMWMAIVADTGASLLVTANSLRLLRAR